LIAYSPLTVTLTLLAIIDLSTSLINILPNQLEAKELDLQIGHLSPSTNNLQFLQAFFFAIFIHPYSF